MLNKVNLNKLRGFTLIELLVVMAILAVLAVTVFVALDPAQRLLDARNSRRSAAVQNILTAVHECIVDNDGVYADCDSSFTTPLALTQLGTAATGCDDACPSSTAAAACLDLSTSLGSYLASIPEDPLNGTAAETKYGIEIDSNGLVTVHSCDAEGGEVINASR